MTRAPRHDSLSPCHPDLPNPPSPAAQTPTASERAGSHGRARQATLSAWRSPVQLPSQEGAQPPLVQFSDGAPENPAGHDAWHLLNDAVPSQLPFGSRLLAGRVGSAAAGQA